MPMNNLTTRILVALIGIPILVYAVLTGGYVFFVLIAALSTIGQVEFYRLVRAKGANPLLALGIAFGLFFNAVFMYDKIHIDVLTALDRMGLSLPLPTMAQFVLIGLLLMIPLILLAELFRQKPAALLNVSTTIFGIAYVSLFFGSLVGIRELFVPADFPVYRHFPEIVGPDIPPSVKATIYSWGGWTVLAILGSIWACDTAAYFAGKLWGRRKLLPRVSPNKTWEGAVAGFLAALGVFLLVRSLALPYLDLGSAVVCGVIIGSLGQMGDLVESLLKRDAGVKDSSALIPGHGGVLDRFDSLLFVSPLLFLYLDFVLF
jgi:phosphatidate cytidylyltransferase